MVLTTMQLAERHAGVLGELTDLGMAVARVLHDDIVGAETPEVRTGLALSFQRTSRSVRQTVALEARLHYDRLKSEREAAHEEARRRDRDLTIRKARVKAAVERLIWTEYEGVDAEELELTLEDHLDAAILEDGFETEDLDILVTALASDLGLNAPSVTDLRSAPPPPPRSACRGGEDASLLPCPEEDGVEEAVAQRVIDNCLSITATRARVARRRGR